MRSVSILAVADPALWDELEALVPLADHVEEVLDDHRRVVTPSFERELLPELGDRVLVRYARRDARQAAADRAKLSHEVDALRHDTRRVLHAAQRHALDDIVIGRQAWDPLHDAPAVRALHGAGLIEPLPDAQAEPYTGRYRLHADLPPPPPIAYDFSEAVMDETDDLVAEVDTGPVRLLHDMASLAAALEHHDVRVTHAGTVTMAEARQVGRKLADAVLNETGRLEEHPRWGRALRGLQALQVVSMDPVQRTLHLDMGLEGTLAGTAEDATDRLIHRLLDRDLHAVVPAVRQALRQAGEGAIDEMIFLEELRDQHRDVLLPPWEREGQKVYPRLGDEPVRPWDDDAFDAVEARMIRAALARMARFGLLRRAPGVFAGTEDGRRWARAIDVPHPPIWVSGDLEIIVPPDSLTPWERFQLARMSRCLQRDVVDRYRLERRHLETWLATHEAEEALELLARRCPALPGTVRETVEAWTASATRVVLTRGVLMA